MALARRRDWHAELRVIAPPKIARRCSARSIYGRDAITMSDASRDALILDAISRRLIRVEAEGALTVPLRLPFTLCASTAHYSRYAAR